MDLLKPEDLERNRQVIVAGYGWQYLEDRRLANIPLKFTKMHMFMEKIVDLNETILFFEKYTKICTGRFS